MSTAFRIGIGGSAADPPHLGHKAMLEAVLASGQFDLFIWFPSGFRDEKPNLTLAGHRAAMAGLLIPKQWVYRKHPQLKVDYRSVYGPDIPAYRLLETIRCEYKNARVSFVTGSDAVTPLPDGSLPISRWIKWDTALAQEEFFILPRTGFANPDTVLLPENCSWINYQGQIPDFQSRVIRSQISADNSLWKSAVPYAVKQYILNHRLYQKPE